MRFNKEQVLFVSLFWPIDFCGLKITQKLVKKPKRIKQGYYYILAVYVFLGIVMFPSWGNPKDFFMCASL